MKSWMIWILLFSLMFLQLWYHFGVIVSYLLFVIQSYAHVYYIQVFLMRDTIVASEYLIWNIQMELTD